MPIDIDITGTTAQQNQDIGDAFDQTIAGRAEAGMTKAQWVKFHMKLFMRNVVKGWKRKAHEDAIATEQNQVDTDFE